MIKKIISLVIVTFTVINSQFAQQTVDNEKAHRRYWYYRTRMINDFMKIGKEQGACIVLAQRNKDEDNLGNPELQSKVGPDQIDITNQYIMALALEYKLLSRNHQDTRETIKELYHLLYAINRLDLEAEQFFTTGMLPNNEIIQQNGQQNGFILREDMPKSFFTQNKLHFNYALEERPAGSTDPDENYGGFTGLQHTNDLSDDNKFSGYFPYQNSVSTELTLVQDKYMSMLTAMMFVKKYIPFTESYGNETFQQGGSSIQQEATNIANRCYAYLKNKNGLWDLNYEDNYGNFLYPLTVGNTAYTYSWPLSRMACMASRSFPWNIPGNNSTCNGYNDFTALAGRATYNLIISNSSNCFEDPAVFKAWCQAGSNSLAYVTGGNNAPIGVPLPIYIVMQQNTSLNNLEWADLLRKVLHQDGALLQQLSVYGNAINVAPCKGPYNYGSCTHGGWEWSSQDRLEHPDARGFGCNGNTPQHPVPCVSYIQNSGFQGNYPGVDYMLLHNLYYEYQNQVAIGGNNGNIGGNVLAAGGGGGGLFGNILTGIINSVTNAVNTVNSTLCDNGIPVYFAGNNICDQIEANTPKPYYAINYMDNMDENIWPRKINFVGPNIPNNYQGTDFIPSKVAVFQNLSSVAHIYASASPAAPQNTIPSNVTYRAGKEIVLEPGFTVDQGSTFHAYVQRYVCNGNDDALNMRKLKDSTLTIDLADYETDMINPVPIHYIESPKSDSDNYPVVSEDTSTEDYIADLKPLDEVKTSEFGILPNPTTGKTIVHTKKSNDDEVFSIHVYDMKGGLIYIYENVSSDFEINLSGYSKGVYMIRVTSNLGNSATKKISLVE